MHAKWHIHGEMHAKWHMKQNSKILLAQIVPSVVDSTI